jgi:ABC-type multidrug transport system fused ATPase/permease subunit
VIVHGLSTIRNEDKIIVLDQGRDAVMGDPQQLINRRGLYRQLYTRQMGLAPPPV